jgi:opacity protein-like surface antigen
MTFLPRRATLLVLACLLLSPAPARADFFAVPFLGMKFGGSTSIVDLELAAGKKKLVLGASLLNLDAGIIGYEVEFANTQSYFSNADLKVVGRALVKHGSYVTDLTGSVVFALPPGATRGGLRPYLVLGGGLIHAEAEDVFDVFQVRRTVPAITLGAGATGMFTNNVGVRFDVRHLRSLSSDDAPVGDVGRRIAYSRFTIGLLLRP